MSRTLSCGVLAVLITAVGSTPATANWWGYPSYSSGYYNVSYYYPVATPVYYVVSPAAFVCPAPVVRAPVGNGYAQPQPAPPSGSPSPSQSREPPLDKKKIEAPKVNESQSFSLGDLKAVPVAADSNAICRVGFWNIAGRDVKLTVGDKVYTVPRDRNLTLTVNRTFSWKLDG